METLSIFLALVSFITGASIGSFLNVVIYRLPRGLSVNKPKRSFCPSCKYKIPSYFNIPLFSWLILKGKCKNCGEKVSCRYFLVELLTGFLFFLCWLIYGADFQGNIYYTISLVLPGWIFIALIISASFIDFEHQIIPDKINLIGVLFGLTCAFFIPIIPSAFMGLESNKFFGLSCDMQLCSLLHSLFGGVTGFLLIYLVVILGRIVFGSKVLSKNSSGKWIIKEGAENPILIYDNKDIGFEDIYFVGTEKLIIDTKEVVINGELVKTDNLIIYYDHLVLNGEVIKIKDWVSLEGGFSRITYLREAMGFGDVKFMAMIGVFTGWQGVLFTLFAASIIGTIISFPSKFMKNDSVMNRIPFGPFLSIGSIIWIFCGPGLFKWYLELIGR